MENQDDSAIFALPVSSSDEDDNTQSDRKANLPRKSKSELPKPQTSPPKRAAATAASSRSKRRKLTDLPDIRSGNVPDKAPDTELFLEWTSSGSQKKRPPKSYAQRKVYQVPDPVEENTESTEKKLAFTVHDQIELGSKRSSSRKTFVGAPPLPGVKDENKDRESKQTLAVAKLPQEIAPSKESAFRMPGLPEFTSSATTVGTDVPSIFEAAISPGGSHDSRSTSSSSLSSARSPSPLEHDIDLPPVSRRCPACRKFVMDSTRLFVPDNLRKLSLQKQQEFCLAHQLSEARDFWEQSNYPEIHWEDLEHKRIPGKLSSLKKIIFRQQNSFYLDELDHRIQEAKGNRRKIQTYLSQGVVDVAKPGYYGLKGSRIMANAITDSLTEALVEALQTDSAIRHAGVGAYVTAVLVPELTLLLVMEDMHLGNPEKGRRVLAESSPVGLLLNPDDDHIERDDDDDGDA
ncbi:uncharacterized protein A1O9_04265 [Exophiala aquamarina CBS 119918]|uniref:Restriction of telomere capping protein 4 n=1 Tax=Exophiala aquamarina CBS 119918 TaxID=1182545 RepID=A0A072PHS1_9EURO|nr:uncharacterized protein A1O9_04265 [Exophiala aquamarina CBS 119918]KEF59421.1 hypothetical protein A1O9_04265 [Exophiala aquamarina CBS 119918]